MERERRSPVLYVLVVSAFLVSAVIHVRFVPRYFPHDSFESAVFILTGWMTFALAFYGLGRLFSQSGRLPSMRTGDAGIAVFLLSLLVALFLDSLGFRPDVIVEAYVVPAVGVYVGLALIGWSVGKRTAAINRIATEE